MIQIVLSSPRDTSVDENSCFGRSHRRQDGGRSASEPGYVASWKASRAAFEPNVRLPGELSHSRKPNKHGGNEYRTDDKGIDQDAQPKSETEFDDSA